ncbi:MAG: HD domain-containing protein [Nitrospiraceae bacterium]|nr:HD domain-containing protein [Nitrospiraceae bacterium]
MKTLAVSRQFEYMLEKCRRVEGPDSDGSYHVDRVGELAYHMALALGIPPGPALELGLASKIHDIGKTAVAPHILGKSGRLTPQECEAVRKHTVLGAEIISSNKDPIFDQARKIALFHHERWDGTGYPHGLKEKNIPLSARIAAVADSLDVMTHRRPYKVSWPADVAIENLVADSGKQFDPEIIWVIAVRPYAFLQRICNVGRRGF